MRNIRAIINRQFGLLMLMDNLLVVLPEKKYLTSGPAASLNGRRAIAGADKPLFGDVADHP
jgi:hypothetical protein